MDATIVGLQLLLRGYSGVLQGSILRYLLFLLYVDDLTTVTRICKLKLFADDVQEA